MASFDIVSKVDPQTLDNAVNNAKKELTTRFDLRDTKGGIEFDKKANTITLSSENSMKLKHLEDIVLTRVVKQGIDGTALDFSADEEPVGALIRKVVKVRAGIDKETTRKVMQVIKESKIKVTAQVMDDQVRVTGKQIDDLQKIISALRRADVGLPLQFVNMKS